MQQNRRRKNQEVINASDLGVGLNLHLDHLRELSIEKSELPYIEVIGDNWLSPGPHHGLLESLRADYPVYFHCVGANVAGVDKLNLDYLKAIKELADRFDVVHISDHLSVQQHNDVCFHDLLPFPLTKNWLDHCTDRILQIQEYLNRPIAIENLSYYVEFEESEITESQFLNELADKTHCGILLDLNNVWVNEKNLGINTNSFISEIDLKNVWEIHLAGPELKDGIYVDTHGSDVRDDIISYFSQLDKEYISQIPIFYERDNHRPSFSKLVEHAQEVEQKIVGIYG